MFKKIIIPVLAFLSFLSCSPRKDMIESQASITTWKDNKKGAISLTYDDGTINQFTVALPIMNKFNFSATYYVITGKIPGSQYKGKFIGRDVKTIIAETATIPTQENNFFERASAIGFTGYEGALDYHSRAGSLVDAGKKEEAYAVIDEGYAKIRKGQLKGKGQFLFFDNREDTTTWEDYRRYAAMGHEIASHTVTHPRLAALDEVNLLYELEKSREEIINNLGEAYTFSAECPYGTENERVMEYAHKIYPALRNRMPETYMTELNRASKINPGESTKEYVQWQRGPLKKVSMETMKSWVDTVVVHNNIWLVLVFHGVDDIGWEPRSGDDLEEYFGYMKEKEESLWVATFADVTKYIRERKNTELVTNLDGNSIHIKTSCMLDRKMYNLPVTLKVNVPDNINVVVKDNTNQKTISHSSYKGEKESYILFNVLPFDADITIEAIE